MSLNELLLDKEKPWLNIRVQNITVDGYSVPLSQTTGLTGGFNPSNSQSNHQYELSNFSGGGIVSLGSTSSAGQVLSFTVVQTMIGACTISAGGALISGSLVGNTGSSKYYSSAGNIIVGTTASVGDFFELRSTEIGTWLLHGVVRATTSYT